MLKDLTIDLGYIPGALAEMGEALGRSDHNSPLILVTDDVEKRKAVAVAWAKEPG